LWWFFVLFVVTGELYGGRRSYSGHRKKKKKMPAVFWVVEKLLCGPLFLLLLLFLYWPEVSVFSGKFRWSPAMFQRAFSYCFVLFFNVLLLFLGTASLFYVFSASVKAPTKLCISRRVSDDVSNSCFPANLVG
jgi:hypothetical protein